MKKNYNKRMIAATCILMLGSTYHTSASGVSDPSATPRVSTRGNFSNVKAEGDINQTFNDHGPKGGNAVSAPVFNLGNNAEREKRPQDYFEEGRRYFYMDPPNYSQAQTYFLRAAGAEEKHIKIDSYLHCAKCVTQTNPSNAMNYYEEVLKIEPHDDAYRGLMTLDYDLITEEEDDSEYILEVLTRAVEYGKKIRRQTKEDRKLLKEMQHTLSTLSLKPSAAVEAAFSQLSLSGDQKPSAEQSFTDDMSTLSSDSFEHQKKSGGVTPISPSNNSLTSLVSEAKRGVKKARLALETLAEEGDFEACMAMISLYEEGIVIKRDPSKIFYFMCQAAEAGSPEYQMKVGKAYEEGQGISQDLEEALRYYRLAALNENEEAMVSIAHLYASNQHLKDENQAVEWYLKAAQKGNIQGIVSLSNGYATSSWGLKNTDSRALEWYLKSGEKGSVEVWYNLGLSFEKGTSLTPINEETAFYWYEKAAVSNHFLSLQKVVEFYQQERALLAGASSEAIRWYQKGAEHNDATSIIELSLCHMNEYGGLSSTTRDAIQWYAKAAALGNADSLFKLSESYLSQVGGLQSDSREALTVYEQAGSQGHLLSQLHLGALYKEGKGGVSKNNNEAKKWYMMASQRGSAAARSILASGVLEKAPLPPIAQGYEQIYERFMNGALVYKPNSTNDVGKLTFPFRDWVNPETLRGTCPLSTCGDAGNYLIINSGYRTQKSGQSKVEVFITPRFLVEKEMGKTLGHYSVHSQKWTSEVGILFSWGTWDDNSWGVYQTKDTFDEISSQSLYQIIEKSPALSGPVLFIRHIVAPVQQNFYSIFR